MSSSDRIAAKLSVSQHEGTANLVQLRDELVLLVGIVNVQVEPIVELLGTCKDVGDQEIEQSPQFMQIILQRSSLESKDGVTV